MSLVSSIAECQKSLEARVLKRFEEFEAKFIRTTTVNTTDPAPASQDMCKLSNEFSSFKKETWDIFQLLRQQIAEIHKSVDSIEMHTRRKVILFNGVNENEGEDLLSLTLDIIHSQLGATDISASDLKSCHRLGESRAGRDRPVLIRFGDHSKKSSIWKLKTKLKGSKISMAEFLTRSRQEIFFKARQHFGVRRVWSTDGNISIRTSDGARHRLGSAEDLLQLMSKFPDAKSSAPSDAAARLASPTAITGPNTQKRQPGSRIQTRQTCKRNAK